MPLQKNPYATYFDLMTPKNFGQRPPRLDQLFQTYNEPVYFVTFCTHRRKALLASNRVHLAFIAFTDRACREFNIAVGRHVLMPDHVHLFVCGGQNFLLGRWIGALKQALARGLDHSKSEEQIWQEGFFDHVLRNDESMSQKWEYIWQNPMRAGLVGRPEDWPYQGEIVAIDRA